MTITGTEAEALKVIFWDLDGTLWTGTLEEDADELTVPRSEVREFILEVDRRGILNCVVSQASQSAANARLLDAGLDHLFVASRYDVGSKASAITSTLTELNLLPRNAAFIDDLPFCRAEVAELLPEVLTLSPDDLASFAENPRLQASSSLSTNRRQLYQTESLRRSEEVHFAGNRGDFLASCSMEMACDEAQPGSPEEHRVTELLTRAHRMSSAPLDKLGTSGVALFGSLVDRFGDYGIIAGARIVRERRAEEEVLVCTNLVISCRVQGRGVLEAFLKWVADWAIRSGQATAPELHVATCSEVNLPLRTALRMCGFSAIRRDSTRGSEREVLALVKPDRLAVPSWISLGSGR